ncbi:hypothetical protein [Bacillus alkalisoli]|uniref:hypothetical protein n=1 Tax=Bacillus alkalisoli TaxID=2011008 RepID=UPI000C24B8A5|nr:hypothetical protein [Bacillus alkalisoli]
MKAENYIKQTLHLHNIPVIENDLPYIFDVLTTIYKEQTNLTIFPNLNEEVPVVVVDPGVIKHD